MIIQTPLAKSGDSPTHETDVLFWQLYNSPEVMVNEKEVDREKLRLSLISHGIEAGEAIIILNYYIRLGAIAQYNTTTLIKTALYEDLLRTKGVVNTVNQQLEEAQIKKDRANTFKIPKEMLRRIQAGCALSSEFAMIKVNENGEVERLIPDADWKKENGEVSPT
jgi:hypothetical protein